MSPRRYDGWEPQERHDHYDADGTFTGTTVITREAEWDDRSRDEAEAHYLLPGKTCGCGCGQDAELTQSSTQGWDVDTSVCEAGRALAIAQRQFEKRHEDAKPDRFGALPGDGMLWHIQPHETKG